MDARYQVERAREAASEGRFARDRLERKRGPKKRRAARVATAAANRKAASPTPTHRWRTPPSNEPRSSTADAALRVVFGERRDEVAAPASRRRRYGRPARASLGQASRCRAEAALAALGVVVAKAASRQSSEEAGEGGRRRCRQRPLRGAAPGVSAAAAPPLLAAAASRRVDIASKAEHLLRKTAAATAAAAAAVHCRRRRPDRAWWRALAAEALNADHQTTAPPMR